MSEVAAPYGKEAAQQPVAGPEAQPVEAVAVKETGGETGLAKKEKFTPQLVANAISKLPSQLTNLKEAFAKPWESFRAAFKDPAEADRVMQREVTYAAQAMLSNPYLIACAQNNEIEFINALKNVALSGLSLSPVMKQGYLVPFKGKIQFMPSYMGMADLLANTGHVRKIEAHNVFKGDEFSIEHGTEERLVHRPDPWGIRTKETFLGGYWLAELADGTKLFGHMNREEIDLIMKRSPSIGKTDKHGNPVTSPWDTDYLEMARKTVLRRGFKSLPKGSISDERLKVVEAVFDYDEKVEQEWIKSQKTRPSKGGYSFDESQVETVTAEEVE